MSRTAALLAALLLGLLAVLATASPARAHDELLGSDPAANSTVDTLPAELTLTFSGAIAPDAGASEVQVTDAAGTALTEGEPSVQDNVLTQPLTAGAPEGVASGAVTVLWKVVSSDGHPISGEFSFTVAGAPAPTPTETAEPAPTETSAPVDTATPEPTPSTASVSDEESTVGGVWPWILLGLVVAAAAGAMIYLLVSRARRERALAQARGESAAGAPRPGSEPPADR